MPEGKPANYAKIATILAVIMLLSIGLCGVSLYTQSRDEYFTLLGLVSFIVFLASAAGLFLTGVCALLERLTRPRDRRRP